MIKVQFTGVEHEARGFEPGPVYLFSLRSIHRIADNGTANRCAVYADLVGAASFETQVEQGTFAMTR